MLKNILKAYFSNIWHVFTLLGVIAIGIILVFSIFIPQIINDASRTSNELIALFNSASIDGTKVMQMLSDKIAQLNWNDPLSALTTMLSNDWLAQTISAILAELKVGGEQLMPQVTAIVNSFISNSFNSLLSCFVSIGISALVGYLLVRIMIQTRMTRTYGLIRFTISTLLSSVFLLGSLALTIYLCYICGTIYGFLFLTLTTLVSCFGYLLVAWFCYNKRHIMKLKEVYTLKNILIMLASTLIMVGLSIGIAALCFYLIVPWVSYIITVSLLTITIILVDVSASSFVSFYSKKKYEEMNKDKNDSNQEKKQPNKIETKEAK